MGYFCVFYCVVIFCCVAYLNRCLLLLQFASFYCVVSFYLSHDALIDPLLKRWNKRYTTHCSNNLSRVKFSFIISYIYITWIISLKIFPGRRSGILCGCISSAGQKLLKKWPQESWPKARSQRRPKWAASCTRWATGGASITADTRCYLRGSSHISCPSCMPGCTSSRHSPPSCVPVLPSSVWTPCRPTCESGMEILSRSIILFIYFSVSSVVYINIWIVLLCRSIYHYLLTFHLHTLMFWTSLTLPFE